MLRELQFSHLFTTLCSSQGEELSPSSILEQLVLFWEVYSYDDGTDFLCIAVTSADIFLVETCIP
jgi:hypothetical protein